MRPRLRLNWFERLVLGRRDGVTIVAVHQPAGREVEITLPAVTVSD